jgi:hypothetical protein
LEIKGLKFSRGSIYAHIKRAYNLKGNKEKVLKQFEELIERKSDHWYDVVVNGAVRETIYGEYASVMGHADRYADDGPIDIKLVRRTPEEVAKETVSKKA